MQKMTMLQVFLMLFLMITLPDCAQARRRNRKSKGRPVKNEQANKPINVDAKVNIDIKLQQSLSSMARQLMALQDFSEARIRTEGNSGIKRVRHIVSGTRPYFSPSHSGPNSICGIHDHGQFHQVMGMGEFVAVLNGVEFRTRHNDYGLVMASRTSNKYHQTEPLPFPEVPPAVSKQKSVSGQIAEMREWFRAWKDQNETHRAYKDYFRPVLCYLEGAWTKKSGNSFEESFDSERHFIEASSFLDLTEKIRFNDYTGRKNPRENLAYLPTKLVEVANTSVPTPVLAQWNYRILCNPISGDLPLNRLRVVDELAARMKKGPGRPLTLDELRQTRIARFTLDPRDTGRWYKEHPIRHGLLDKLMYQIPGKDNFPGKIKDHVMGEVAYEYESNNKLLNAARYHRWFKVRAAGASGSQVRSRGFSDDNMFVALTTHPQVAQMSAVYCDDKKVCKPMAQRVSYAIPLEIIYLTPLSKWNPHRVHYKGKAWSTLGKTVNANGRTGKENKASKAYDGINNHLYYQTPFEFYTDSKDANADVADTNPKGAVYVLDKRRIVRTMQSSGHRTFLPEIPGVGRLRQRYPIMPVHGEGSSVWMELEALKDYMTYKNAN